MTEQQIKDEAVKMAYKDSESENWESGVTNDVRLFLRSRFKKHYKALVEEERIKRLKGFDECIVW